MDNNKKYTQEKEKAGSDKVTQKLIAVYEHTNSSRKEFCEMLGKDVSYYSTLRSFLSQNRPASASFIRYIENRFRVNFEKDSAEHIGQKIRLSNSQGGLMGATTMGSDVDRRLKELELENKLMKVELEDVKLHYRMLSERLRRLEETMEINQN